MSGKRYGKLVRDKIPEIIRAKGQIPNVRVMEADEYRRELLYKLIEESEEARRAADTNKNELSTELADVLEVLDTVITEFGIDLDELRTLQTKRRNERGGFMGKIFLDSVEE